MLQAEMEQLIGFPGPLEAGFLILADDKSGQEMVRANFMGSEKRTDGGFRLPGKFVKFA